MIRCSGSEDVLWDIKKVLSANKHERHWPYPLGCGCDAEARQHGAGFYAFDRDEAARAEQMAALDERRRATEAARGQRRAAVAKKQTALQQRLLKIRQRKRQKLGLPPLGENGP